LTWKVGEREKKKRQESFIKKVGESKRKSSKYKESLGWLVRESERRKPRKFNPKSRRKWKEK
jgi:hypothetical protein